MGIVERLRACANGFGNFKSPKGDYGLCDDAADEIERLQRELSTARRAGLLEAAEIAQQVAAETDLPFSLHTGSAIAAAIRAKAEGRS